MILLFLERVHKRFIVLERFDFIVYQLPRSFCLLLLLLWMGVFVRVEKLLFDSFFIVLLEFYWIFACGLVMRKRNLNLNWIVSFSSNKDLLLQPFYSAFFFLFEWIVLLCLLVFCCWIKSNKKFVDKSFRIFWRFFSRFFPEWIRIFFAEIKKGEKENLWTMNMKFAYLFRDSTFVDSGFVCKSE